ncbi:acetate permease [Achromobacter sp. B7]|nr:acetate permease [Achromobacter sp. B7]
MRRRTANRRSAGTPVRRIAGPPDRRNAGSPDRRNAGTPVRPFSPVCRNRRWPIPMRAARSACTSAAR